MLPKMFNEQTLEDIITFLWLLCSTGYIFIYQWWCTWVITGVLPDDTWFVMLLLFLFCFPAFVDLYDHGFLEKWYDGAQILHNNILHWLLSDMRPLGFLYWILVLLGLVLYATVVQW
uniref:ORF7 protein n=2 Tax=unclassified Orthocoronavirinae TaxID=2730119 RepID=A0AA49EBE7_9NIDO|nr:ORF7 protein [Bat Coronavirus MrGD19]WCC62207.1 ORF7 protein [Bat Coronavirus MrGD17]WCC62221.1 ORF7 protein [Bat Coronavirus MrGD17]WCC62235.1 ORF7 protein [Bat Coronavirus MrGD17]